MLAKFGFDTAENKPCKVCPLSAYRSPRFNPVTRLRGKEWPLPSLITPLTMPEGFNEPRVVSLTHG